MSESDDTNVQSQPPDETPKTAQTREPSSASPIMPEGGLTEPERSKSTLRDIITTIGTVVGIALAVVMIAVMFYIGETEYAPGESDRRAKLIELETKHNEKLNSYGWMNKKKDTAHIPIDQAMQSIVDKAK